jgi:drug/metabolite transporter (DMT)-like permease
VSLATRAGAPSRVAIWAALITIYFVWGSTYLGIRIALDGIPPFLMASGRYVLAGVLLLMWVALRHGPRALLAPRRQWMAALVTGLLFIPFGNGGVVWGEQYGTSGLAAVVVCTTPLWMAVMGRFLLGERLSRLGIAGLLLGFAGLAILVGPAAVKPADLAPLIAFLLAAIGWSAASVLSKRLDVAPDPFQASGMQMLLGGLLVGIASLATGEHFSPAAVTPKSWAAFAYLVVIGAVLGFSVYLFLLKWAPISLVATYAYVNPVVAVILGVIVLGEPLSAPMLIGGAVVLVAVAVIVAAQARNRGDDRSEASARAPERAPEPV